MATYSEDLLKMAQETFDMFDKDKDGKLILNELIEAYKMIGGPLTKEQAEERMKTLDKDNNGSLDLKEFMLLIFGPPQDPKDFILDPPIDETDCLPPENIDFTQYPYCMGDGEEPGQEELKEPESQEPIEEVQEQVEN